MGARRDPLDGWTRLPGDSLPLAFSRHALDRFLERCRPGLDRETAERELSRLLATAEIRREPPDWVHAEGDNPAFLCVADIVLPLVFRPRDQGTLIATTALTPSSPGDEARARRSERRGRRSAERAQRGDYGRLMLRISGHRREGRPPVPPPSIDEWE